MEWDYSGTMPFWMKTRVGPRNHVLDKGADSQWEGAIVQAIQKHWQSSKFLGPANGSGGHSPDMNNGLVPNLK